MSIALVTTEGFGNGTLVGSIKDVTLEGYSFGIAPPQDEYFEFFYGRIRTNRTIVRGTINDETVILNGEI